MRNDLTSESLVPLRQIYFDEPLSSSDAHTRAPAIFCGRASLHLPRKQSRVEPALEETRKTGTYNYYKVATLLRFSRTYHGLDGSGVDVHGTWSLDVRNCTSLTILLTNKSLPYFVRYFEGKSQESSHSREYSAGLVAEYLEPDDLSP